MNVTMLPIVSKKIRLICFIVLFFFHKHVNVRPIVILIYCQAQPPLVIFQLMIERMRKSVLRPGDENFTII